MKSLWVNPRPWDISWAAWKSKGEILIYTSECFGGWLLEVYYNFSLSDQMSTCDSILWNVRASAAGHLEKRAWKQSSVWDKNAKRDQTRQRRGSSGFCLLLSCPTFWGGMRFSPLPPPPLGFHIGAKVDPLLLTKLQRQIKNYSSAFAGNGYCSLTSVHRFFF